MVLGGGSIRKPTLRNTIERDSEIVQCLQNLGVSKSVAYLISYLKDMNERSYQDIEEATGLRQPEVSIAMRVFREQGWITERDIRRCPRARTSKTYALRQTLEEITRHYEEVEQIESARISEAIGKLKELYSA